MARSENTIQQSIIGSLVALLASLGITIDPSTWSMFDYRQLLTFVVAQAIATLEQLWDAYTAFIETQIASAAPQTNLWIQNFVLNVFQYSSTVPQIIQFDTTNIAPYYATVNAALRIVTQCAIIPGNSGITIVLAAKGGTTPIPLTSGTGSELNALQSTLSLLDVPGIKMIAVSNSSDKLFLGGTVTYDGNYSAIISATVIAAINAYLRAIPTTGIVAPNSPVGLMKLTDLIAAVRAVPGVIDFQLNNVNVRLNATAFPPATYNMVNNNNWLLNEWNSGLQGGAGYIIPETTTGYMLTDSLTFIPE